MTPLQQCVQNAIDALGAWLTDNTVEVFEEQPEIDGIRLTLQEALWAESSSTEKSNG
jgi:hypothetical protein